MKMNCFETETSLNGIRVSIYSITGIEDHMSPNERYRHTWKLSREFPDNTLAVPFRNGEEIMAVGKGPPEISFKDLIAKRKTITPLDMSDLSMRSAMATIINEVIKKRMRHKGYRTEGGVILPKYPSSKTLANGEPILLYNDGCKIQVDGLTGGHIIVWIDPKVRVKQRASDYIFWRQKGQNNTEIESELLGEKVKLEPYNMTGKVESLRWDQTPATYTLEASPYLKEKTGKNVLSLQDYWWHTHHIRIAADETPLIGIKLRGREQIVTYPASMVFLSTAGKSYPHNIRKSFTMPSIHRVKKTEDLATIILGEPFVMGEHEIRFNLAMADESRLIKIGKVLRTGKVEKPMLLMSRIQKASKPIELLKYGPFSGSRHIPVYYIFPEHPRLNISQFHQNLQRFARELKLGKLENIGKTPVHFSGQKPTRNDYWDAARYAGDEIDRIMKDLKENDLKLGKPVLISVLPSKDQEVYAGGKQGAHAGKHSIQDIILSTAIHIAQDNKYMAYNTVTQIYLKSLEKGEAPWILELPAGNAKGTAYLGYDVSRRHDEETGERKEAAATISMVDSRGRHLLNKIHTTQSGEKLDQKTANRVVFEVSGEAHRTFQKYGETFQRLVIFKDGVIRKEETENIRLGTKAAIHDMIPKATMPDEIIADLVSVVKSGIERMYQDNGYNPNDGEYVVFSDYSAVVVTSNLGTRVQEMTVQTTRLEPKFRLTEKEEKDGIPIDIDQLVKEFSDLCNLDWASLYRQPKYPIVLRLVQKLGEQYTLDISDPSYLPL